MDSMLLSCGLKESHSPSSPHGAPTADEIEIDRRRKKSKNKNFIKKRQAMNNN